MSWDECAINGAGGGGASGWTGSGGKSGRMMRHRAAIEDFEGLFRLRVGLSSFENLLISIFGRRSLAQRTSAGLVGRILAAGGGVVAGSGTV